jgi:predicted HD superfamily hydrolase involved in NAD metabolism
MTNRETDDLSRILEQARTFARNRLSDKRFGHTERVADTAEHLARVHSLHPERTRLAALLHDAAREVNRHKLLRLAENWNLPVDKPERTSPGILHGPVAAEMSRRELGIEDEEVLEAIRIHTTAAPGMSPIALAVYIADKIEPSRDYPSVERLRELAETDLHEVTREALHRVIEYNESRGRTIHPDSRKALNWLEGR